MQWGNTWAPFAKLCVNHKSSNQSLSHFYLHLFSAINWIQCSAKAILFVLWSYAFSTFLYNIFSVILYDLYLISNLNLCWRWFTMWLIQNVFFYDSIHCLHVFFHESNQYRNIDTVSSFMITFHGVAVSILPSSIVLVGATVSILTLSTILVSAAVTIMSSFMILAIAAISILSQSSMILVVAAVYR